MKNNDGQTLTIFLLNKNQAKTSSTVDLDLTSFTGFNAQSAVAFEATDNSVGPLNVHSLAVTKTGSHVTFTMPKNSFARVTVTRPPPTVTVTFTPAKDAMVKYAASGTNFGTATNMQVSGQSGFAKQMFLQFNVSGIPTGATVTSATLRINATTTGSSRPVAAHTVSSTSWSETGITWSNKPALGVTLSTVSSHTAGVDTQWNVMSAVTGNGNRSFGLDSSYAGDTNFNARESGAATSPELVIVYQP